MLDFDGDGEIGLRIIRMKSTINVLKGKLAEGGAWKHEPLG